MKVAFLFLHPFWGGSLGSTKRIEELCTSLTKFGVKSYILTPYEKSQIISEGVEVVSLSDTIQKLGVNQFVYGLTKKAYYNPFLMKHLMIKEGLSSVFVDKLSDNIAGVVQKLGIDLVQVEQDIILVALAKKIQKLSLPVVADVHNISAEELVAVGTIKSDSKEFDIIQKRSKYAYSLADSVVVVSDEMREYVIKNYGLSPEKVAVVPPGGRPIIDKVGEKSPPLKAVYSGLVANRENVELFIRSMPATLRKSPMAKFYITKKGRALKRVKKLAKEAGVNPSFFWIHNRTNFNYFLQSCHVGILPSASDLARKMGTPVKLFDYLSAGLPVVANDVGTWTNLIRKENIGIVTESNEDDFSEGIVRFFEDPELAIQSGQRGIDLVKGKCHWDNSASVLYNQYKRLAK